MKLRIAAFLGLLCLFVLIHPPAALMDSVVNRISNGRIRIAHAEGSFWRGQGLLTTYDGQRLLTAWRPVEWRFSLHPLKLALGATLGEQGQPQLALTLTPGGFRIDTLTLDLPLGIITAGIKHPVAQAGWRGGLHLDSKGLVCNWQKSCEGRIVAEWSSVALDILPNSQLGDHQIILQALGKEFQVDLQTLRGDFILSGSGTLNPQGIFHFNGEISGDPEIVDRIPNVMGRNAQPTEQSGKVRITLP